MRRAFLAAVPPIRLAEHGQHAFHLRPNRVQHDGVRVATDARGARSGFLAEVVEHPPRRPAVERDGPLGLAKRRFQVAELTSHVPVRPATTEQSAGLVGVVDVLRELA